MLTGMLQLGKGREHTADLACGEPDQIPAVVIMLPRCRKLSTGAGAPVSLTHAAGLTPAAWLALLAGLTLLAAAGWADVISAVFRQTIIQLATPDELRGRLTGLQMAVVTAGPRLGDAEAGIVANAFGPVASVLSGGLACIAGALAIARLLPGFRYLRTPATNGRDG